MQVLGQEPVPELEQERERGLRRPDSERGQEAQWAAMASATAAYWPLEPEIESAEQAGLAVFVVGGVRPAPALEASEGFWASGASEESEAGQAQVQIQVQDQVQSQDQDCFRVAVFWPTRVWEFLPSKEESEGHWGPPHRSLHSHHHKDRKGRRHHQGRHGEGAEFMSVV